MKISAVIPARYASSRFPGKPLAAINGRPMIQHVYEKAQQCGPIDRVVVATDDERIIRAVEAFGGHAVMTDGGHQTGTDRIAEAARNIDADILVNVQGDEPLVPPAAIADAVQPLIEDSSIPLGTLKTAILDTDDVHNPHIVKVVTDDKGFALYFSRSAIPWCNPHQGSPMRRYRHIGIYAFQRDFLYAFTALERSSLEILEQLEQLRALEHGWPIRVVETSYYPVGVDVPEDIQRVEKILAGM